MNKFGNIKLYRARDGMLLGVCLGLARGLELPVGIVRAVFVLTVLFTGILPGCIAYLLAAIILDPEPIVEPGSQAEEGFYTRFTSSRISALQEVSQRMENLGKRIGRLEDIVTRSDIAWESRLKKR